MQAYCQVLGGRDFEDDEDDFTNMLTDMMHFCERKGIGFEGDLRVARKDYQYDREIDTPVSQKGNTKAETCEQKFLDYQKSCKAFIKEVRREQDRRLLFIVGSACFMVGLHLLLKTFA
jgi:hypothetical protein